MLGGVAGGGPVSVSGLTSPRRPLFNGHMTNTTPPAATASELVPDEIRPGHAWDVIAGTEFRGTITDEGVHSLKRGRFAAWSSKCRNPRGVVGFFDSKEAAQVAIDVLYVPEPDLTPASKDLFRALAEDAGNWGGTPPTDGNVQIGAAGRGNLTQLKRAGLLTTFKCDGDTWVDFTPEGVAYAARLGIRIS